jgi:hypothetical protein
VFANGGYGSIYSVFREHYWKPEPQPDVFNLRVGSVLSVDAPGLMANDKYVDPAKCSAMLVTPPAHGSASLLAINKAQVAGQNSVQGTVTLASAPTVPASVGISDNSALVSTPSTVPVPAGQVSKNFQIQSAPVSSPVAVTITATFGASTQSRTLTLIPLAPTAVVFKPSTVVGGNKVQTRIVINGVAGVGGLAVSLSSSSPHALLPVSVTVPPGGSDLNFSFTTTHQSASVLAEIMATAVGGSKKAYLRINP